MSYSVAIGGRKLSRKTRWLMLSFAIAWGLLSVLVVLQDHAIDAQRELIHLLLQDLHQNLARTAQLQQAVGHFNSVVTPIPAATPDRSHSHAQVPAAKTPSPTVQQHSSKSLASPSSQVKAPPSSKPDRTSRKALKALPVRPPAEMTDPLDKRRVSISI